MKILIADKLATKAIESLKSLGAEVHLNPDLKASDLPSAIQDHEVLVVRSTKVTEETIRAGENLAVIVRAGAGVNTIDLETASERGIYVCNCPGKNNAAVAELTIGLMVAADRQLFEANSELRSGRWEKKKFSKANGLKGRTLGVIGLGSIGKAVAKAAQGLEMKVVAWSRSLCDAEAQGLGIERLDSPIEVAKASDVVSLHLAFNSETQKLIDEAFLDSLRPSSILINTTRGDLLPTRLIEYAIRERQVKVATDVIDNEPEGGSAAFEATELAKSISLTPHIGASTEQAAGAIADEVVRIVATYQTEGQPVGVVNLCARSKATHHLVVRHFNRVGVLASVLDGLRSENINVEEMDNVIFAGTKAACCTLLLDECPSPKLLEDFRKNDSMISVSLSPAE